MKGVTKGKLERLAAGPQGPEAETLRRFTIVILLLLVFGNIGFSQSNWSANGYSWANSMLDLSDDDHVSSYISEAAGRRFYYMFAELDTNGFAVRSKWIERDEHIKSLVGDTSLTEELGPMHLSNEFMTIREYLFGDSTVFFSGDPGTSTYRRCDVAVLKIDDIMIAGYSLGKIDSRTALLAILKRYLVCSADDLSKIASIILTATPRSR